MSVSSDAKPSRRQQILEALAQELEGHPGARITTARLAQVLGVSEAALYRHFPSKARMFESLIGFAEDSVFGLARRIVEEEAGDAERCSARLLGMLLTFSERNPGITRILVGDALVGESERLQTRVAQFFDRFETQLKQVLREAEARRTTAVAVPVSAAAGLMVAVAEGRMSRYVRSRFRVSPVEDWERQWALLGAGLFAAAGDGRR